MIDFTSMNIRIWSRLGSCGAFGQAALVLPEVEPRTVILTADLCSFSGLERFKGQYPDRLYNVGIAEQSMGRSRGHGMGRGQPVVQGIQARLGTEAQQHQK